MQPAVPFLQDVPRATQQHVRVVVTGPSQRAADEGATHSAKAPCQAHVTKHLALQANKWASAHNLRTPRGCCINSSIWERRKHVASKFTACCDWDPTSTNLS